MLVSSSKRINIQTLRRHFLFWTVYIGINSLLYGIDQNRLLVWQIALDHTLSLPFYFITTYLTAYLLIPKLLFRNKYLLFFILFSSLILIFGYLEILKTNEILPLITGEIPINATTGYPYNLYGISRGCFFILVPVIAFCVLKYARDWHNIYLEKQALERKHLSDELHLLKSQLHPQFLLTTLENLVKIAAKDPVKAAPGIDSIAEMLSFILYECSASRIELRKELSLIRNFIKLQEMNKAGKIETAFSVVGSVELILLPPMLLFSLVEYVFKCAENRDEKLKITLFLEIFGKDVDFWAESNYCPEILTSSHSDPGLQNLRKRLELVYPGKATLEVKQVGDSYVMHLNVKP
jgi:hypothetical protein